MADRSLAREARGSQVNLLKRTLVPRQQRACNKGGLDTEQTAYLFKGDPRRLTRRRAPVSGVCVCVCVTVGCV